MWIDLMSWWCRLFGYVSCGQLSTFEAIVLAAVALVATMISLSIAFGLLGLLASRN
jgi:hypothetical protein